MNAARRNSGEVPIHGEYRAVQQITPHTWALIIALIATLSTWGATAYATAQQLEKKADREVIEVQLRRMQDDIRDIKTDVREMRRQGEWNGNGNGYISPSR